MIKQTSQSDELTVGIYVPSYHRSGKIITDRILKQCKYVVRESEAEAYRRSGVREVIAVPDELISNFPKTRNWIIDNAPEDIVIQIDDDVNRFAYVHTNNVIHVTDSEQIECELFRIAQMISDLNIGFAACKMQVNVVRYNQEFRFTGTLGQCCWYNKAALKSRYDENVTSKADIDFELQELLRNRIVLIPDYFHADGIVDKNKGGNQENKTTPRVHKCVDYLKQKWGKYYEHDFEKNSCHIRVKR